MTKGISNSHGVLLSIPEEHRSQILHKLDLDRDQLPVERALGLHWCVQTDVFKFKMALKEQPHTRRGILSVVSSVYDPLGFLAPQTLPAEFILQDACRRSHGWDDQIPTVLQQQWIKWLQDLEKVMAFKVERCLKPPDFGKPTHGQLHHFSDASESGYGTVTYLRMQNNSNNIHVSFTLGKARVAPLKQVTIPRLELTAAVLAVRVDAMLRAELQLPLENSCFWTGSTSEMRTGDFKPLWRTEYLPSEEQPMYTSGGMFIPLRALQTKPQEDLQWIILLTDRRWINGPEFLWKKEKWPESSLDSNIAANSFSPWRCMGGDHKEDKADINISTTSANLDDEGFHTVLCEVEAILNDRPITKLSEDPHDLEALTPNHLLTMKRKPVLPPELF